jgi:hypothetical protein
VAALGAGSGFDVRDAGAAPPGSPVTVRGPRECERSRADVPDRAGAEVADESVESVGSAPATAGMAAIAAPTPRAIANAPTRPM